MANLNQDELRARLALLPRETLRNILIDAISPAKKLHTNPDGSQTISVPASPTPLLFRLSADDMRL